MELKIAEDGVDVHVDAWAASLGLIEPMAAGHGEKLPVSYRIVKLPEYCHEQHCLAYRVQISNPD